MIRIVQINRRPLFDSDGRPKETTDSTALSPVSCVVQVSLDRFINKGLFDLTEDEAAAFDVFAQLIERRIADNIAGPRTEAGCSSPLANETAPPLASAAAGGSDG